MLIIANTAISQNLRLNTNVGFAGYGHPFDGYFFAFDVAIPVCKFIEIDTTFSFHSNITDGYNDYSWREGYYDDFGSWIKPSFTESTISETTSGVMAGDMMLYLNIKPFQLFKREKLNKIDIGIGVGYGLKVFQKYYYNFEDNTVVSIRSEAGILSTLGIKIFYNYHFKNCYLGTMIGVADVLDDAPSIISLQFGVVINNSKDK